MCISPGKVVTIHLSMFCISILFVSTIDLFEIWPPLISTIFSCQMSNFNTRYQFSFTLHISGCRDTCSLRVTGQWLKEPSPGLSPFTSTRDSADRFNLALLSPIIRQSQRMFSSNSGSKDIDKSKLQAPESDGSRLSHVDHEGRAQMINVRQKEETNRVAIATATVNLGPEAFRLVKENKIRKGDALTVAQLAGIMACKSTSNLIPLCHNIPITHAEVNFNLDEENHAVRLTGSVNSIGRTGVEMEALTAVCVASLTLYDMCKVVSHGITITNVKLVKKSGGKTGDYNAE